MLSPGLREALIHCLDRYVGPLSSGEVVLLSREDFDALTEATAESMADRWLAGDVEWAGDQG
jgi:hypothetical protein